MAHQWAKGLCVKLQRTFWIEVAAYILDVPRNDTRSLYHAEVGFAIPSAALVKCLHGGFNHPDGFGGSPKNMKIGSLQMYMKNLGVVRIWSWFLPS